MTVPSNTGKGLKGICILSKPQYLFETSFNADDTFRTNKSLEAKQNRRFSKHNYYNSERRDVKDKIIRQNR